MPVVQGVLEPVSVPAAAAAAGMPAARAGQLLQSWPGVFWDDRDLVAGFWGLSLAPMPRRIRRAGTDLHAWCAWDPFFLARVIGDLHVTTADPVSGKAITYHIASNGAITAASHPQAALSFLRPSQPWDNEVMTTFCHKARRSTPVQSYVQLMGHAGRPECAQIGSTRCTGAGNSD